MLLPAKESSFSTALSSLYLPGSFNNQTVTGTLVDVLNGTAASTDIALINCEDTSYQTDLATTPAKAVVMYALRLSTCALPGQHPEYGAAILTTTSNVAARTVLGMLGGTQGNITASVVPTGQTPASNSGGYINQPTAMIALYTVAGIVLILFFSVLIIGGVRARRHPERYGARAGTARRPPRSAAKGIAAAVLDTVSSVRLFGKEDAPKDVEMQHDTEEQQPTEDGVQERPASGPNTDDDDTSMHKEETMRTCPICCDDFTEGQEVRALPCHHIFHPACVDPWLTNVSGVCPMCREKLAPDQVDPGVSVLAPNSAFDSAPAHTLAGSEPTLAGSAIAPGIANAQRRTSTNFLSRYLDLMNHRNTSDQSRTDALRRLGEDRRRQDGDSAPPIRDERTRRIGLRTFFHRRRDPTV